jgi:hypothetical protein
LIAIIVSLLRVVHGIRLGQGVRRELDAPVTDLFSRGDLRLQRAAGRDVAPVTGGRSGAEISAVAGSSKIR